MVAAFKMFIIYEFKKQKFFLKRHIVGAKKKNTLKNNFGCKEKGFNHWFEIFPEIMYT